MDLFILLNAHLHFTMRQFNRYVKKGEKGIQIIAPAPIKEVEEREKIDKDTGMAVLNENGEPEMERVEYVVPRFRLTTVFDISQTDGEPIPSLEVNELTSSVKDYNMIDGCVNNVPQKPRRIGGRWSVLDRLHIKQAERRQKDNTPQQEQERSRKN